MYLLKAPAGTKITIVAVLHKGLVRPKPYLEVKAKLADTEAVQYVEASPMLLGLRIRLARIRAIMILRTVIRLA